MSAETTALIIDDRRSNKLDANIGTRWRLLTDTQAWPRRGPSVLAVDAPARVGG
jgi:hypothetical protein